MRKICCSEQWNLVNWPAEFGKISTATHLDSSQFIGVVCNMQFNMLLCVMAFNRWFYGDITSEHAKQLLLQAGKHGSYLVRTRQTVSEQFALSLRLDDDVLHIVIVYQVI